MRNSGLPRVFDINMNNGQPHDYRHEPRLNENDPVWALLARAPRPQPDGWFTARTLARCRASGPVKAAGFVLGGMWRWALGGGLSLCLAVLLLAPQIHSGPTAADKQKNVQEAFAIMASLDTSDDDSSTAASASSAAPSSLWQD